jgi:hypothetical protein
MIALAVFLAYALACMIAIDGIGLDEVSLGELVDLDGISSLLMGLLWGAGAVFVASFVLDSSAAKLPTAPVQRLVVVMVLACGAIVFALWFDSILAADDDRDVFGWLTIPAAAIFGLLVRLPSPHGESGQTLGQSVAK